MRNKAKHFIGKAVIQCKTKKVSCSDMTEIITM